MAELVETELEIQAGTAPEVPVFEGFVDTYGYDVLAGGWCFAGWATCSIGDIAGIGWAKADFGGEAVQGEAFAQAFPREDVAEKNAAGFLLFLPGAPVAAPLRALGFHGGEELIPVAGAFEPSSRDLAARIASILSFMKVPPEGTALTRRLLGDPGRSGGGHVEYYGFHEDAGGWFLGGWAARGWQEGAAPEQALLFFEQGELHGKVVAVPYARGDLPDGAVGILIFAPGGTARYGKLLETRLGLDGGILTLPSTDGLGPADGADITERGLAALGGVRPGPAAAALRNILTRAPYQGETTLGGLAPAIFFHAEHAARCGEHGLLLTGWMLEKPEEILSVRICCGGRRIALEPARMARVGRADVLDEYARYGFDDSACGFVIHAPDILRGGGQPYIEVLTRDYKAGYAALPALEPANLAFMRRMLDQVDIRYAELAPAFDNVLGPALEEMNRDRLSRRGGREIVEYGVAPGKPRYSVVIPLHGRLDFAEIQMALFSAWAGSAEVEWVFVLDDPPKRREARKLFASVHERFRIPFRIVLLEQNLGFAPATNEGLALCHGDYVVFLNSDVFPGTPDWLDRLALRLDSNPALGAVGPLLVYGDGAVQHRGMYYERLAEFAGWYFCQHRGKGRRHEGDGGFEDALSITGACMMLRREHAVALGGFDEVYAVGDFEDSDLCLKLRDMGYECGVDLGTELYHLERQSQTGAAAWRMALTAYNAWQHQRRWGEVITRLQADAFPAPGAA